VVEAVEVSQRGAWQILGDLQPYLDRDIDHDVLPASGGLEGKRRPYL
jgi:hypothetical protein